MVRFPIALIASSRRILLAAAFSCLAGACFAEPSNRPILVDETGTVVEYACVVPLYRKLSGVAWGIEGKSTVAPDQYLMKPFRFSSGDDFLAKIVPWGRMFLPFGVMSFGDGWGLDTRLLLRSGYKPVAPKLFELNIEKALILPKDTDHEAEEALKIILATPPDQDKLRALFKVKELIRINLSQEEIQLLRACVDTARTVESSEQ